MLLNFRFYIQYLKRPPLLITFIILFCMSILLSIHVHGELLKKEQRIFRQDAEKAHRLVKERIELYRMVLLNLKSFFEASREQFSFDEFHYYYESLRPQKIFPALHSIGYIQILNKDEVNDVYVYLKDFFKKNKTLSACLSFKPPLTEKNYLILRYAEPINRGCRALGRDLSVLPFRLQTAEEAMRYMFAVTPPISLIQDKIKSPAILMMMPVFQNDPIANANRKAEGLVRITFQIPVMFSDITQDPIWKKFYFRVDDVTDKKKFFVHSNQTILETEEIHSAFQYVEPLNLGNRYWVITVYGLSRNYGNYSLWVSLGFFIGLNLLNILFLGMICWYWYSKEQTKNLKQTILEREAVLRSTHSGLFWVNNSKIMWANDRLFEILGINQQDVLLKSANIFFTDRGVTQESNHFYDHYQQLVHLRQQESFEIKWRRQDQREIWCWFRGHLIDQADPSRGEIWSLEDITEQKVLQQEIYHFAYHDPLTHLLNRRAFEERLEYALLLAREYQEKLALVFIDLDYFKQVNDQFGHQTGDLLLIKLAEYMRQLAKEGDIIARLAGDEFVMILPRYETKDAIKNVLDKLLAYLARPHLLGVNTIQSSCSIGVAFFPTDAHTPKHLKECADQAMYEAKRKGRAQYYFYTEYES